MEKIAIISTRLGGIDGVSIEASKWAEAFKILGLNIVYIAGKIGPRINDNYHKIEEMDYYHPKIMAIRKLAFSGCIEDPKKITRLKKELNIIKDKIKSKLLDIITKDKIDYLSIENAMSIPLNIPLGIALGQIISETKLKAVTRHHDFYWERDEFRRNNIESILDKYFPSYSKNLIHVVINTLAQSSLYNRKGIKAFYIPNAFDFNQLEKHKKKSPNLRTDLNIGKKDYIFLQPTRIIERKKIERSIELVEKVSRKIDKKIHLFITGKPERSELEYFYKIERLGKRVNLILNKNIYSEKGRYLERDIFKVYNIYNAYHNSDMVTLPSDIEGFGNPVIEACIFKKPLFVNNYPVLGDMLKKGFDFIVMNKIVDIDCVEKTTRILKDNRYRTKMVERNYVIAKKFYSIKSLVERLRKIIYND